MFDSWTSNAADLAWRLSGATEPISVNLMRVHLPAEIEDDIFHDWDSRLPVDEDSCLLGDALEAILIDEDQGYTDPHPTPPSLVSSGGPAPMPERELWMRVANPVCLAVEDLHKLLTSL